MKRRFFLGFFLPESSKMQLHPIVEGAIDDGFAYICC